MSLIGATKESILRELDGEPKHGYAIANVADISKGVIYSHLRELEVGVMVPVDEEEEDGRGDKTYRLTEAGELIVEALKKEE